MGLTGTLSRFYADHRPRLPSLYGGFEALTVDRYAHKVARACEHRHLFWHTAQACAEKMTRKFVKDQGP